MKKITKEVEKRREFYRSKGILVNQSKIKKRFPFRGNKRLFIGSYPDPVVNLSNL